MPIALSFAARSVFFLLMNAFFVAAEFSLVRVRKSQVEILVDEGRKGAKYTKLVADNVNAYLSACQLGITLASLALGWLGEPAVSALFEPLFKALNVPEAATHGISIVIGFVIITALHIVVGELIPKSLAIFSTERYALFTATPLVWFYRITYPVMWLFNSITNGVMKMLGHDVANEHEVYTDEEIKLLIDESTESGLIDPEQNEYVDNIFDLGDKDAEAIMTPRTDVVCIDLDDPLEESLQTVLQYKYTRYPVCRGSKDRIVGFVHVKDLYTMPKDATVDDLRVRMIQAVPEGVPIAKLLQTLQEKRTKIAVVIDEHGGTAGIVTMSDIMEQIVGRIDDELRAWRLGRDRAVGRWQLPHRRSLPIDEVGELIGFEPLESEECETAGGLLLTVFDRIPDEGDSVTIEDGDDRATFTVVDMDRHRIDKIRVVLEHAPESDES